MLLPTLFYLAVHVRASEAGEPPTSAPQLAACALVVLGRPLPPTTLPPPTPTPYPYPYPYP